MTKIVSQYFDLLLNLTDDIMEAYRPFVDKMVFNYISMHDDISKLNKEIKTYLLNIATQDVLIDNKVRPLMIAVTTTTASLYKCYNNEKRNLKLQVLD